MHHPLLVRFTTTKAARPGATDRARQDHLGAVLLTSSPVLAEVPAPRQADAVSYEILPTIYDHGVQPIPRIRITTRAGDDVILRASELAAAISVAGVPLRVPTPPSEIAALALAGVRRVGLDQVRQLDRDTRAAALSGLATGEWSEHQRLTKGRNPGTASWLACQLLGAGRAAALAEV
jgi:hypothetical protein